MRFRPCIDIHNGKVKQIVGSSLRDSGDTASENFVAGKDAAWYAELYKKYGLSGGHVILLNSTSSPYYEATREQAFMALHAYPGGLMAGGGVNDGNAKDFLNAGASHVIVTSFLFRDGAFCADRLSSLEKAVGSDRIVIDLSARKRNGRYYVVTDRWQTFTAQPVTDSFLDSLSSHCSEFLIHGVDAEGKTAGMEKELVSFLSSWNKLPVSYAGGCGSLEDLRNFAQITDGRIDFTIGSALDLFGGTVPFREILNFREQKSDS